MPVRPAGGLSGFYPTIGAAIAAGFPWLTFSCPGCRMVGTVDLRNRPPPGRVHLQPDPIAVLPPVLAERAVREARSAAGRAGAFRLEVSDIEQIYSDLRAQYFRIGDVEVAADVKGVNQESMRTSACRVAHAGGRGRGGKPRP